MVTTVVANATVSAGDGEDGKPYVVMTLHGDGPGLPAIFVGALDPDLARTLADALLDAASPLP